MHNSLLLPLSTGVNHISAIRLVSVANSAHPSWLPCICALPIIATEFLTPVGSLRFSSRAQSIRMLSQRFSFRLGVKL